MDYSLLWLDWKPRTGLPEYTRNIIGMPATRQGKAALRELLSGLRAMGAEAELRGRQASGAPAVRLTEYLGNGERVILRRSGDGMELVGTGRGLLYGVFRLLRHLAMGEAYPEWESSPAYPIRMLDHWDNADGSIERGYAGLSFFFKNGKPVCTERTRDYARLLASCGLNGCCINNVNVRENALKLLTSYQKELKRLSVCLAEYGVSLWLSVSFSAPIELGGLDTADPLDESVKKWWKDTCLRLFTTIPNLAGFLVKADSEGRPGPHSYGRSQAEGANMLAEAVEPYGGKVLWRCFVYNCTQDWRDTKTDRARAQCDHFAPLDGQFRDNVYLQIKNGPVDFQIREPVSPLPGHLEHTASLMEFQLAQEYTGQQRHVCYLIPMFREILDFQFRFREEKDSTAERISAICAVSNTGDDFNWTGHDLAAANLFGFGLLSWEPDADPAQIAREWSILTFGDDAVVTDTVTDILLRSAAVYEKYTAPLGIGWMCVPETHYGPSPEGFEFDRWGTYLRANHREIGVERGPAGTGYSEQYSPELAAMYGSIGTCPEELLLFFHRVPFDYRMKDGRTLLQRIYDDHFEGYAEAAEMSAAWDRLEGKLEEQAFRRVQERFRMQLHSAAEWRDVVNTWLYRLTMLPDEKGRKIYP